MVNIFLSHSSPDEKLAHELAEQIRKELELSPEEIFVSSEPTAIPSGDWFSDVLAHLDKADVFIALITPLSEKSVWVTFEYGHFWGQNGNTKLFVLRHPKATIPNPLNTLQWKLVTDHIHLEVFFRSLCEAVAREYRQEAMLDLIVKVALETPLESAEERKLKADLIHQMGSPDNSTAVNAVRELTRYGWLTDGSLRGQNFARASLQNASLSYADLQGADLNHADLREAAFIEAKLQGANLGGARFDKLSKNSPRAATFWYANLENAILGSATLYDVEFGGANLKNADFRGAELVGAKIDENTQINDEIVLPDGQKCLQKTDFDRFTQWIVLG